MPTFTYYEDIPQSTDIISESQPQILQNFTSIDSILNVDHYTFESSTNTDGQHKQVTFGGNNPASPSPPGMPVTVSPPVLFTNTVDGAGNALPNSVPELFFYSGTHQQGQDNYISLANGSVLLFGGIILQWGVITVNANPTPVTMPVAFPNNVFNVQATANAIGSGFIASTGAIIDKQHFNVYLAPSLGQNVYWIAIGN